MRVFLTIVLPLLAPALIYAAYFGTIERRREKALAEGAAAPWWAAAPWPWLLLAGVALSGAVFAFMALTGGADPHSVYVPAQMEDGRLVPGRQGAPDGGVPRPERSAL